MSLENLSRLRQGVYRLAGAGFSHPTGELIAAAGGTLAVLEELGLFDYSFAPAVTEAVEALAVADADEVAVAYVALFDAGVAGAACPPHESAHLGNSRTGEVAEIQSDLKRSYLRYGLRTAVGSADMVDHVSTEMHVMAMLCAHEASRHGSNRPSDRAVRNQSEFLTGHVLRWVPRFTAKVRSTDRHAVYSALAGGLHAFLAHERQLLPLLVEAAEGGTS